MALCVFLDESGAGVMLIVLLLSPQSNDDGVLGMFPHKALTKQENIKQQDTLPNQHLGFMT